MCVCVCNLLGPDSASTQGVEKTQPARLSTRSDQKPRSSLGHVALRVHPGSSLPASRDRAGFSHSITTGRLGNKYVPPTDVRRVVRTGTREGGRVDRRTLRLKTNALVPADCRVPGAPSCTLPPPWPHLPSSSPEMHSRARERKYTPPPPPTPRLKGRLWRFGGGPHLTTSVSPSERHSRQSSG